MVRCVSVGMIHAWGKRHTTRHVGVVKKDVEVICLFVGDGKWKNPKFHPPFEDLLVFWNLGSQKSWIMIGWQEFVQSMSNRSMNWLGIPPSAFHFSEFPFVTCGMGFCLWTTKRNAHLFKRWVGCDTDLSFTLRHKFDQEMKMDEDCTSFQADTWGLNKDSQLGHEDTM